MLGATLIVFYKGAVIFKNRSKTVFRGIRNSLTTNDFHSKGSREACELAGGFPLSAHPFSITLSHFLYKCLVYYVQCTHINTMAGKIYQHPLIQVYSYHYLKTRPFFQGRM